MSENLDLEKSKYESLKDLAPMDLIARKQTMLKELKKAREALLAFDTDKASERQKMAKALEKLEDQLTSLVVIDKLLKEKDF